MSKDPIRPGQIQGDSGADKRFMGWALFGLPIDLSQPNAPRVTGSTNEREATKKSAVKKRGV